MKLFEVELKRLSYITFHVEADDQDEAEQNAYDLLDCPDDELELWEVEYCREFDIEGEQK